MPALETPADRFRVAMELFQLAQAMMRAQLERELPPGEVDDAMQRWLLDRPGAPCGDACAEAPWGRPVPWPQP